MEYWIDEYSRSLNRQGIQNHQNAAHTRAVQDKTDEPQIWVPRIHQEAKILRKLKRLVQGARTDDKATLANTFRPYLEGASTEIWQLTLNHVYVLLDFLGMELWALSRDLIDIGTKVGNKDSTAYMRLWNSSMDARLIPADIYRLYTDEELQDAVVEKEVVAGEVVTGCQRLVKKKNAVMRASTTVETWEEEWFVMRGAVGGDERMGSYCERMRRRQRDAGIRPENWGVSKRTWNNDHEVRRSAGNLERTSLARKVRRDKWWDTKQEVPLLALNGMRMELEGVPR